VKSPPELWAEVSDPGALAGHLEPFGEIRITRLEPESTVAWEGDRARGTVELEPAGWGTKVTLTARLEGERGAEEEPAPETAAPEPEGESAPVDEAAAAAPPEPPDEPPEAPAPPRRGLLARLLGRRRAPEAVAPPPADEPEPGPAPEPDVTAPPPPASAHEPAPLDAGRAEEVLVGVLDDLGAARHRPFSRG